MVSHHGLFCFREGYLNPNERSKGLPECLEISAWTEEGEIMGLRHREYKVEGVQFYPESILTPLGSLIIKNFIYPIPA